MIADILSLITLEHLIILLAGALLVILILTSDNKE